MSRFGTEEVLLSNALVPLAYGEPVTARPHAAVRANAEFVAQLIATSAQAPQTRIRRRAEPEEAVAAYGALDHGAPSAGRTLSRSLEIRQKMYVTLAERRPRLAAGRHACR